MLEPRMTGFERCEAFIYLMITQCSSMLLAGVYNFITLKLETKQFKATSIAPVIVRRSEHGGNDCNKNPRHCCNAIYSRKCHQWHLVCTLNTKVRSSEIRRAYKCENWWFCIHYSQAFVSTSAGVLNSLLYYSSVPVKTELPRYFLLQTRLTPSPSPIFH